MHRVALAQRIAGGIGVEGEAIVVLVQAAGRLAPKQPFSPTSFEATSGWE